MSSTMFRKSLPHWRSEGATYFCTWRVFPCAADLAPQERDVVCRAIRHFDGQRYALHSFVVMNDHVHVLFRPFDGFTVGTLLHSWKSFTAHALQRAGSRRGSVWQSEYFDRIVRNERDLREKADYIANNPRKRWPDLADADPWSAP